jgi:hypothetical protein
MKCRWSVAVGISCVLGCGAKVETTEDGSGGQDGGVVCTDPVPIPQSTGEPSGFERCAEGIVRRVEAVSCVQPTAASNCDGTGDACDTNEDCVAAPFGTCAQDSSFFACECAYGCSSDSDCGPGEICACPGVIDERSRCIEANCITDADCGGGVCGVSIREGACGSMSGRAACLDETAACQTHADCSGSVYCSEVGGDLPAECALRYVDDTRIEWTCGEPSGCTICG